MARKYQAYTEYKDSAIDWLSKIPIDWHLWKISHACPYVASGTTPKADDDVYYGGEILWVTTGELREEIIFDTQKKVNNKALIDMPTLRVHPKGSVAIAMYGATIGRLGIFGKNATTNQACCVMPPSAILHNKFLFYWLFATKKEIINLSSGGGQPNVNQEKIASLKVSAPEFNLQEHIANFLDHETAKIDALKEKQQQLIKLLKEKRQAVISHAVTKGLNPQAPMCDSGVEWLGEVPAHWVVSAIKYELISLDFRRVPLSGEERSDRSGEYRYYGASGVIDYIDDYIFDESTVLVGEDGANLVNRSTPLAFGAHGKYWVNNHAHILKPSDQLVEYWAETIEHIDINPIVSGSAQPKLTAENLNNLKITFPSFFEERQQISNYILTQKSKFKALIDLVEMQISLLQERRTALISAAVTGKIDVRNWQANQPATQKEIAL